MQARARAQSEGRPTDEATAVRGRAFLWAGTPALPHRPGTGVLDSQRAVGRADVDILWDETEYLRPPAKLATSLSRTPRVAADPPVDGQTGARPTHADPPSASDARRTCSRVYP